MAMNLEGITQLATMHTCWTRHIQIIEQLDMFDWIGIQIIGQLDMFDWIGIQIIGQVGMLD